MLEIVVWILIFGGFFTLRGILATILFFNLLSDGDRCPICDAVTVRIQAPVRTLLLPRFRPSWCLTCGWRGMLRAGPLSSGAESPALTKHSGR
jgi:hypothetical protein